MNAVAPALIPNVKNRPYLTPDWTRRPWNARQAYAESKLYVTALTLARAWPYIFSNAVDPGWVPTKTGGPSATGDLRLGYLTQTWLAVSHDPAATVSGARTPPHPRQDHPQALVGTSLGQQRPATWRCGRAPRPG